MRVRLVRRPGQHGTKRHVEQYGDRLVCVRYRYDEAGRRRFTTVEIIVDEAPWEPPTDLAESLETPDRQRSPDKGEATRFRQLHPSTLVGVRLPKGMEQLAPRLVGAGAVRRDLLDIWAIRYDAASALGVQAYIVDRVEALVLQWSRRGSAR